MTGGNAPQGGFTPEATKRLLDGASDAAAELSSITTIIFDFGCVLSLVPRPEDYEPLRKAMGAEPAAFEEAYWAHREAYDYDTLDVYSYFQKIGNAGGVTFSRKQIQGFARMDTQMWARPNAIMVEWVQALRGRGFKTAVLSNMSVYVADYLRREAKWLELFDHLCFSGELKTGKPHSAIYRACLESLGVGAGHTLFVDDREVNIKAAEALGMHGIVFHSAEQLLPELEPYRLAESLAGVLARAR